MKRNAKQTGSGGRLRLGLLLATAAAFLLVPASAALAAPTLELNLISINEGGGEVESNSGTPFPGSPELACDLPEGEGSSQSGTCTTTMSPAEGVWAVAMLGEPGPDSVLKEWTVHAPGEPIFPQCEGVFILTCGVFTENETETVVVDVVFERVNPTLEVNITNLGDGGGGEVVSPSTTVPFPGTPPLACNLPEGGTQEGTCENLMQFLEPGISGISTRAIPAPNSEFVEWVVGPGSFLPGTSCALNPASLQCGFVISEGEDVVLEAIFACEAGKECPEAPPPAGPPLTVKFEEGEGTVVSNPAGIECTEAAPSEACTTEEIEAGSVTLTASPAANNLFKSWKGCTSVEGRKCTVSLTEAKTIGVKFSPAHAVTIEKSNNGLGSTSGVTCAYTCTEATASFADTKVVKLKAKAYKTADFTGWNGEVPPACEIGAPLECLLPAEAGDKTVQAEFTEKAKETLTVNKTGKGQGAVKSKPAGINCSYTCSSNAAYFYNGTSVELTASVQAGKGSTLGNWSGGGCSGTAATPCVVSMTAAKSVTAEFE